MMTNETNMETIELTSETTEASQTFIGQWNQLISTTNWEKGKIIAQWRETLESDGKPANQITDEAWSQMVGGVTPQHVGRLRRTSERFGHVYTEYQGVYWSHFYAALDWDDAEMWLEGAVQNKWSVSKMRQHRWETLGKVGEDPTASPVVVTEPEEESQSLNLNEGKRNNDRDYIEGPVHEGPDWGDDDGTNKTSGTSNSESNARQDEVQSDGMMTLTAENTAPVIRPFESFDELPEDVMDAANAFKVTIIKHKAEEWSEISRDELLELLDALKQLAIAAS
ncbi:MAG: hypothetical protein AAF939_19345 [Planctomycetota bacterium]